jgi:aspartate aminotransferase-like enzyme
MVADRRLFMVPGPVEPPRFVMEAVLKPVVHQRSTEFRSFFSELQEDLKYVFQTSNPVICLLGSGTFAVELAMRSLFSTGDEVAIPAMGKFSERWAGTALEMGLNAVPMGITWGHGLSVQHVEYVLEEYPNLKGWVLTHCETSTGVSIDLEGIAAIIREKAPHQLIVVDAVSTLAVQPLYSDSWNLDVVVAASQKGLLNPAGTSFMSLSPRARLAMQPAESESYLDLSRYLQFLEDSDYPFTPPTQLFYGIHAALKSIRSQGLPAVWNHTHQLSRVCKSRIPTMGADLFGLSNSDALTVFSLGRLDHSMVRSRLLNEYGIELAGGQGRMADLIIRIGHFGAHGLPELNRALDALEKLIPTLNR